MIVSIIGKILLPFPKNSKALFIIPHNNFSSQSPSFRKMGGVINPSSRIQARKKAASSPTNENVYRLWNLFQGYRKITDGIPEVSETITLCKNITQHYSKSTLNQFSSCKEQLQKLLDSMTSLPFADLTFHQQIILLQFLTAIQSSHIVRRELVVTLRDLLFYSLQSIISDLSSLSLEQNFHLYSSLLALNHPKLFSLAQYILQTLKKGQEKIDDAMAASVIFGLNQRKFLSGADARLLKILVKQIQVNKFQLSLLNLVKCFYASQNIGLHSIFGDYSLLLSLKNLQKNILAKLNDVSFDDLAIQFLVSADFINYHNASIFQLIFEKTFEKIFQNQIHPKIIPILIGSLQRNKKTFTIPQITAVISYLIQCNNNQQKREIVFKEMNYLSSIYHMMNIGCFDGNFDRLYPIIKQDSFEGHWLLALEFSIKGQKFPLEILENKIQAKNLEVYLDSSFIRIAISIGIQSKLYPESQKLQQGYTALKSAIERYKWDEFALQFLVRQSYLHQKYLSIFHNLYKSSYTTQLIPFALVFNPKYYQYLISCSSISEYGGEGNFKEISDGLLEVIIQREFKFGREPNGLLLFIVYKRFQEKKIDVHSGLGRAVIRMLLNYSRSIHKPKISEQQIQIYHKILLKILSLYPTLQKLTIQFHLILKRMIACPISSKYYNSPLREGLIRGCCDEERINDVDLSAIVIRACLNHGGDGLRKVVKRWKGGFSFFSQAELKEIRRKS